MIIEEKNRTPIEFEKIRNGTVFQYEGETYIKGDGGTATNLESGLVTQVNELGVKWDKCYMFTRSTLKLG